MYEDYAAMKQAALTDSGRGFCKALVDGVSTFEALCRDAGIEPASKGVRYKLVDVAHVPPAYVQQATGIARSVARDLGLCGPLDIHFFDKLDFIDEHDEPLYRKAGKRPPWEELVADRPIDGGYDRARAEHGIFIRLGLAEADLIPAIAHECHHFDDVVNYGMDPNDPAERERLERRATAYTEKYLLRREGR